MKQRLYANRPNLIIDNINNKMPLKAFLSGTFERHYYIKAWKAVL